MLRYKSPYKHLFSSKTIFNQRIYTKHQLFVVGIMEIFGGGVQNFTHFTRTNRFKTLQILRSPNKHKSAQFHVIRCEYIFNIYFEFLLKRGGVAPVDVIRFLRVVFCCFENSLNYLTRVRLVLSGAI